VENPQVENPQVENPQVENPVHNKYLYFIFAKTTPHFLLLIKHPVNTLKYMGFTMLLQFNDILIAAGISASHQQIMFCIQQLFVS
jgi:hypothetical protein